MFVTLHQYQALCVIVLTFSNPVTNVSPLSKGEFCKIEDTCLIKTNNFAASRIDFTPSGQPTAMFFLLFQYTDRSPIEETISNLFFDCVTCAKG